MTDNEVDQFREPEVQLMHVGLAEHDGYLWVRYHSLKSGKWRVYLAKVKMK